MTRKDPASPPAAPVSDDGLARLERQVERGSLFTHTELSRSSERLREDETLLHGLIDILVEKGILTEDELHQAAERARQEMASRRDEPRPGIALLMSNDDTGTEPITAVDCARRLHLCRAACCRMQFALTAGEVQSGRIKWDHGQPYYIRQEATGYCSHLEPGSMQCGSYEHRPGVCRRYSCARDERVWKDFDAMVINREWIDAHLGESKPQLVAIRMLPQKLVSSEPDPGKGQA
jgi:Fe-S-cluster containining protein